MGLPQFWCTELLYVSYHWEKLITKTKIWALGADIRVCMGSEEHYLGGNRTRLIGSRPHRRSLLR
jgi:hypothetical protein